MMSPGEILYEINVLIDGKSIPPSPEMILLSLELKNVNLYSTDGEWSTLLMYAVCPNDSLLGKNDLLLVKTILKLYLHKQSTNINSMNMLGMSALKTAAFFGRIAIVEELLKPENKCNINLSAAKTGGTALYDAVSNNQWDMVTLLLEKGADITQVVFGNTVFDCVAKNNDIEHLQLLAKKWPKERRNELYPHLAHAFISATKSKSKTMSTYLWDILKDKYLNTLLIVAVMVGDDKVMRLTLQHGADINHFDQNGNTLLHIAIKNEQTEIALELINKPDFDVYHQNEDDECALYLASKKGNVKVIAALLVQYSLRHSPGDYWKSFNALINYTPSFAERAAYEKTLVQLLTLYASHIDYHPEDTPLIQLQFIDLAIRNNQLLLLKNLLNLPAAETKIQFMQFVRGAITVNSENAVSLLLDVIVQNNEDTGNALGDWQRFSREAIDGCTLHLNVLSSEAMAARYLKRLQNISADDPAIDALMQAAKEYKSRMVKELCDRADLSELKTAIKMDGIKYNNGLSRFLDTVKTSWFDSSVNDIKIEIDKRMPKINKNSSINLSSNNNL